MADDIIELETEKSRKSNLDKWRDLQDYLDANNPKGVVEQFDHKTYKSSTVDTLASISNNSTGTTRKTSDEVSRMYGMETQSRLWSWLASPLGSTPTETSDSGATVTASGVTSVGAPGLEAPAEVDWSKVKKILEEMLEVWSNIHQQKEDDTEENKSSVSKHPGDLSRQLFIKALIEQKKISEESAVNHHSDIVRGRHKAKEFHKKQFDDGEKANQIEKDHRWWGNVNTGVHFVAGAVSFAFIAAAVATTVAPTFPAIAAALPAALGPGGSLAGYFNTHKIALKTFKKVTTVALALLSGATELMHSNANHKLKLNKGELSNVKDLHDMLSTRIMEQVNMMNNHFEKSMSYVKDLSKNEEKNKKTSRLILARH